MPFCSIPVPSMKPVLFAHIVICKHSEPTNLYPWVKHTTNLAKKYIYRKRGSNYLLFVKTFFNTQSHIWMCFFMARNLALENYINFHVIFSNIGRDIKVV